MSFQAVTKMIQEAFSYVEQTPDLETKLKLIDTLRTVTAGKVQTNLGHFDSSTTIQSTPNNSNPPWLQPRTNLNQKQFPLDFLHTFSAILPPVTQTLDNSNLPATWSNFCFPSDHFHVIKFTLVTLSASQ